MTPEIKDYLSAAAVDNGDAVDHIGDYIVALEAERDRLKALLDEVQSLLVRYVERACPPPEQDAQAIDWGKRCVKALRECGLSPLDMGIETNDRTPEVQS